MTDFTVPETLTSGTVQNNCEGNAVYSLKETIVKWLLLCGLEEEMEDIVELPPVLCR